MKRVISAVKTAAKWQRLWALVLATVFMLSAAMTGTVAWADISQHKTNIAKGGGAPRPGDAILQKYEKDKDGNKTTIPVPGVEFTLYKVNPDGTSVLIKSFVTGTDGQILASGLEHGDYYWQETCPAPYYLPEIENGQPKKYFFSIPEDNENPILSTAYNTKSDTCIENEYIDIEGEKIWDMTGVPAGTQLPESIFIQLKNGDVILETATVVQGTDGNWIYSFKNVPKYDALGNEYTYTVEEVRVPGWCPVTEGFNIKNVYQPPVTADSADVKKIITGGTPPVAETFIFILTPLNGAPMPADNQITITGEGTASFGQITYTFPGTYIYTIAEIDGGVSGWHYDTEVYTLTITVTEESGQLKANNALTKKGAPSEKALFTNRYDTGNDTIDVHVIKMWQQDNESERPSNIQVQLYQGNNVYGKPVTLSAANGWEWTWSDLDKSFAWTVDEVEVPSGYIKNISGEQVNGFVITNTKIPEPTTPSSPSQPNTTPSSPSQPDTTPSSPPQPDTTPSSPGNTEIVIRGKKTWDHGANPKTKQPASITVIIKGNGVIVRQRQISAEEDWSWSLSMPEYDNDGNKIVYTVDEAQISDYVKTVDGYNLINTYKPGFNPNKPATPDEPDNPDYPNKPDGPGDTIPKTQDQNDMSFWITIMLISLIICVLLVFPWKRKWNGKQYIIFNNEK